MSLGKMLAVWPLCLALAGPALAEEAPIVKLSEQLRAPGSTGKWKEVGVDQGKARISDAPRVKTSERIVPASAIIGEEQPPPVDWRRLQVEVSQRFADLEACRNRVARMEKVPVENLRAGLVVLRWTILPSGRTSAAIVYQQRETELALMKCIRARMDAWQFTPPSGTPIVIEQTYDFQAALAAVARQQAAAASDPAAPTAPPATDGKAK